MIVSKKRGKFILTRVFPYGAALRSNGDKLECIAVRSKVAGKKWWNQTHESKTIQLTSPTLATLPTSFVTRFANALAVFVAALFLVARCIACNGFGTRWLGGGSRGFRWRVNTHKRKLECWGIDWQQCLAEINHQLGQLTFITFGFAGCGTGGTVVRWSWRVIMHAQFGMLRNVANFNWIQISMLLTHLF